MSAPVQGYSQRTPVADAGKPIAGGNLNKSTSFHKNLHLFRAVSLVGLPSAYFGRPATAIFGGLWHLKALFESGPRASSQGVSKTIWLFSDMMHETREFPMPALLAMGPEQMLERVKTSGLLVPLNGYKIHVYGASPAGLTPQMWTAIKSFWTAYFAAAGAELVSYSAECDIQR